MEGFHRKPRKVPLLNKILAALITVAFASTAAFAADAPASTAKPAMEAASGAKMMKKHTAKKHTKAAKKASEAAASGAMK